MNICNLASGIMKDAMIVSIRYSGARRQFGPPGGAEEVFFTFFPSVVLFFFLFLLDSRFGLCSSKVSPSSIVGRVTVLSVFCRISFSSFRRL